MFKIVKKTRKIRPKNACEGSSALSCMAKNSQKAGFFPPLVGFMEDFRGTWLGFKFLIIKMGGQCPKWPLFEISAFYSEFKGAKDPYVLWVHDGVVEDSRGSWLGFGYLSWWGWVNNLPNDLYLKYLPLHLLSRCKDSLLHRSPYWSCGGHWRFLTGVWVPDHDGDGSTMSEIIYLWSFSFLHWI